MQKPPSDRFMRRILTGACRRRRSAPSRVQHARRTPMQTQQKPMQKFVFERGMFCFERIFSAGEAPAGYGLWSLSLEGRSRDCGSATTSLFCSSFSANHGAWRQCRAGCILLSLRRSHSHIIFHPIRGWTIHFFYHEITSLRSACHLLIILTHQNGMQLLLRRPLLLPYFK